MMRRATAFILPLAAMLGLSGCGYGYGSGGYGYSRVSVGYGAGYYGDPYWGWYGDYYYPGAGIYVYDRYRRPMRWNDDHRRYWEGRRHAWRGGRQFRPNWQGFGERRAVPRGQFRRDQYQRDRGEYRRDVRRDRRYDRRGRRD